MTRDSIAVLLHVYLGEFDIPEELFEEIEGFMNDAYDDGYKDGYDDCYMEGDKYHGN